MDSKLVDEYAARSESKVFKLPPIVERIVGPQLAVSQSHLTPSIADPLQKFQTSLFFLQRVAPLMALISQLLVSLLSFSICTIISRVFIVVFFLLFYFLGLLPHGSNGTTQRRILESMIAESVNGTVLLQ